MKWHNQHPVGGHGQALTPQDFHHWLHENLNLTLEQEQALRPIEDQFEKDQRRIRQEISRAADTLATAIRNDDRDGPELEAALLGLNEAQGKLQKLSLDHFFQMKSQLHPEQAEKLLRWTHESIVGNPVH